MKHYVALLEHVDTHSRTWVKSWPGEDLKTFKKRVCKARSEYKWYMQFSTCDWV